jgi:hypothetical protein
MKILRTIGGRMGGMQSNALCSQAIVIAALGLAAMATVGCDAGGSGKPTAHLSGKVTIDGQPVPNDTRATITFRATGPGQANHTSALITNSEYDCPNVPAGDVEVYIQIVQETGRMASEGGRSWPETRNLIAEKYNDAIPLKVTDDNSNQDFELTSK